jgi:hypothetical protein
MSCGGFIWISVFVTWMRFVLPMPLKVGFLFIMAVIGRRRK